MKELLNKVIRYFTRIPPAISYRNYRFYLVAHVAFNFALFVHTLWLVMFLIAGVYPIALFNIFSVSLFTFLIWMNSKGYLLLPAILGIAEVVVHQILACYIIGWESGYQLYILVVSMYPFIMPWWRNWIKALLFVFTLSGYVFIVIFIKGADPLVHLNEQFMFGLSLSNVFFSFVCLGIWGTYFNYAVYKTEERLDQEYEKSENLLLNILPAPIAKRLKEKKGIISDRFPAVSILFADFVDFTIFSEDKDPDMIVRILNKYFLEFDKLADKYGIEKIKTIGDAYMAAAGVPLERADHACIMAKFAIELMQLLESCNQRFGLDMQMRIGIHCGPVTAGVIGIRKFIYDLWGDTVNTASRMESFGVPGKIQTTEAFYQTCQNLFSFTKRGPVDVKGKGRMCTYFLDCSSSPSL